MEASPRVSPPPVPEELPRPASFTSLPQAPEPADAPFTFSEDDLVPTKTSWSDPSSQDDLRTALHGPEARKSPAHVYSKPPHTSPDSRITVQRTVLVQAQATRGNPPPSTATDNRPSQPALPMKAPGNEDPASPSDAETFSRTKLTKSLSFARKTKQAREASRSPEKSSNDPQNGQISTTPIASATTRAGRFFSRETSTRVPKAQEEAHKDEKSIARSISRGRSKLSKRSAKTFVTTSNEKPAETTNGSVVETTKKPATPLLKSFSNSSIPSLATTTGETPAVPPLPINIGSGNSAVGQERSSKRTDDLWSVFRALDSDFAKFQSKSTALKANVVRSTLLPFLRNHAEHPSNYVLRPEDIDRRIGILGKWWSGLMGLMQGQGNSSLSGSDRPVILEAMSRIMERMEWRYPPSPFAPLTARAKAPSYPRPESTASVGSDGFLLESVHHNVRNSFVQYLFSQMVYVVDRMSLKHAPASLVSFCGKACAYAFFFCPGIANVLVQLWDILPSDLLKILRASDVKDLQSLKPAAELTALNFPACTHSLIFTSVKGISKQLRRTPLLPLGVDQIKWQGHWLSRWSGKDSELFYTFVRDYHSLLLEFIPPDSSPELRLASPGLLLVQTQMLRNLDSTIHRQSALDEANASGVNSQVTFEDMFSADAAAGAAMPSSPLNAARAMSDNRFVMILRDLVADNHGTASALASTLALSFRQVMQAAVCSTSLYDQSACFTICDFLQEALTVITPLQQDASLCESPLQWPFVVTIFKQMVKSENTTTEIRLYSLIFTIWESVLDAGTWRDAMCFDFLLEEEHFMRTFNHWCPMVRAYYMRLVCWRLSRYDGDATDNDVAVLHVLLQRLQKVWAYYKHLDEKARRNNVLRPSTAPCNPAPGRKLLIIRVDTQAATSLLSFNDMLSASNDTNGIHSPPTEAGNSSGIAPASSILERVSATFEYGVDISRKRGSILRSWWGSRTNEGSPRLQSPRGDDKSVASTLKGHQNPGCTSPERNGARSSMYEQRPSQSTPERSPKEASSATSPKKYQHFIPADFKFSLEAVDRGPENSTPDLVLEAPRLPLAAHLLLQSLPDFKDDCQACEIPSKYAAHVRYAGRSLAEWTWVVNECQNFFERRRSEGVPSNRQIETPELGVEPFRRPG
ncbi:MAG: hypothetical protein Q9162_003428 [Coniocarpon cinnabarinum]